MDFTGPVGSNPTVYDISEVRQLQNYQVGYTVYELAAEFDVARNTVCRLLHRHDTPMRHRRRPPQQIADAAKL